MPFRSGRNRMLIQWAFALLPLGLAGCAANVTGPANRDNLNAWREFYRVPGMSVAVFSDFALDYVEAHGVKDIGSRDPVDPRTLFQAASLSKGVTSAGVMALVQDGTVQLDADVNQYLTTWQVPPNALQVSEKVTLRRLLSHTAGTTVSGFRGYRYSEPWPTLVQILNGQPPANSAPVVVDLVPGTRHRYSGGGYQIAEQVVRDVTGLPFPEFMHERVLAPIGMVESTYEQPLPDELRERAPAGYYADGSAVPGGHHVYKEMAAGGLWTTPTDLTRFLTTLLRALQGDTDLVLSPARVQELLREVASDYALGFRLNRRHGQRYIEHQGANDGFRSAFIANLTRGYGLVVMTNSDNGHLLAEAVIETIGKREGWPGY